MTFEWRTDDLRLLGVRQGAFVDRRDWSGRGGTPLRPLGKIVFDLGGGSPDATFWDRAQEGGRAPLQAKLRATDPAHLPAGAIEYELAQGSRKAQVRESLRVLAIQGGWGFARVFEIGAARPVDLDLLLYQDVQPLKTEHTDLCKANDRRWAVVRLANGLRLCLRVEAPSGSALFAGHRKVELCLPKGLREGTVRVVYALLNRAGREELEAIDAGLARQF